MGRLASMNGKRIKTVLGWVAFLTLLVAINWPYQYSTHRSTGPMERVGVSLKVGDGDLALPVVAGWPNHFYYHYDYGQGQPKETLWSYAAIFGNLALVVTIVFGIIIYQRRRRRAVSKKPESQANDAKRGQLSISDLAIATLVIAMPLGYWQLMKRRSDQELALITGIENVGSYTFGADLPQFLEGRLPESFVEACSRVTGVSLSSPDQRGVDGVMQLPHLKVLRIGGGEYALETLAPLPNFRDLTILQISGRELNVPTIQLISQTKRLRHLDLGRTNVSSSAVALLNDLPQLRLLNLIGSGVRLDQLQHPICPQSLNILSLPRPEPGRSDHLVLENYPHLIQLICESYDAPANSTVLDIEIRDCPKFQGLFLGSLQKVSLQLQNLPEMALIESVNTYWKQRVAASESIPGELWVESLEVDGAGKLAKLNFFVRDLKYLRLQNVPQLKSVGVASYRKFGDGTTRQEEVLPPEVVKAMVQGFAESDGPEAIDLAGVPLQGVDLGPLAKNSRIVQLDLSDSNTSMQDWETLREIPQLQILNISKNPEDNVSLAGLLEKFPKLQRLTCDSVGEIDLIIEDKEELEAILMSASLFGRQEQSYSAHLMAWRQQRIRLANLPQFTNTISIGPSAQKIALENVPGLEGLTIHRPLPKDTVLTGFRDLRTFAVGGEHVDDRLVEQLSECHSIQHLALLYASASPQAIGKLLAANPIRTLDLRGTSLDDRIFAETGEMSELKEVYLDDTGVTGKVMQSLKASRMLQTLGINGANLTAAEVDLLDQFKSLKRLHLGGTTLSPSQLKKVTARPRLIHLDLSEQPFSQQHAQALVDARLDGLRYLALSGKDVDPQGIVMLVQRYPQLKFSIPLQTLPLQLYSELLASGRLHLTEQGPSVERLWASVFQMTQDPQRDSARPVEMILQPWMFEPQDEVKFDAEF